MSASSQKCAFRSHDAQFFLIDLYLNGDGYATLQLTGTLHVNSAQTYEAAALAGLGLIQAPLLGIGRYLESGTLVEIIPDFRRRSLVLAHRSNLARRVRAFMKWIENVLAPYLE
jgi:DNA-binding transcriptional LysR family regulator